MNERIKTLVDELAKKHTLTDAQFLQLLADLKKADEDTVTYLYQTANQIRQTVYGKKVYIRGLIEFTNYCKNDCYYCGIRRSNQCANRYRLTKEEILDCCDQGYHLGFRTFVLQGGEDAYYTDEKVCEIVSLIKKKHPDCAVTLSIGEKDYDSYKAYFDAGADRYLLRHETADELHYGRLHPAELSAENRKRCLFDLKEIGYQVGCGIMVGSPGQTAENILSDLRFMEKLQPHMIGIGPFIPHQDTPFKEETPGTLEDTLHLLSILRFMFPQCLLPATTALGTIHPNGREWGIQAGANVVMPNLSPSDVRDKYLLYDGKLSTKEEAAEGCDLLKQRMHAIGFEVVVDRGDCLQV